MKHKMKLYEEPFRAIQSGQKTVEVRLNDQKRRTLNVGDAIEFTKLPEEDETIAVEVISLTNYASFKEMFEDIPAEKFGAMDRDIQESVEAIHTLYSPEREKEWGTLAIELSLIKRT